MIKRLALAFGLLAGLAGCTGFFFQPMKAHVADPRSIGFAYEDVTFQSGDGTGLHGWLFETDRDRVGTILLLHGNAENISTHYVSAVWLVAEGFDVFVFDYRGYGRSAGIPTLDGLHLDAAAAIDFLVTRPGSEPGEIVVFGQSLGGALALNAVAASPHKHRLGAVVVEGAFSDYRGIAREKLDAFWLTWPFQWPLSLTIDGRYSPKAAAADIAPLPLLIIHGQKDVVIPPHHGEILLEAAAEPKTIWRPADAAHIQAFSTSAMRKRFVAYLTALFTDREPHSSEDG